MHNCLQVQDIVHGTCAQLRDLEPSTRPTTMAALARTCKGFYEPAIRVLWREIPGLSPIASLFPEEKVSIEKKGVIRIKTDDVSSAIPRLLFYGPYVRKILYNPRKRLHYETLASLNRSSELPKPLFPNATSTLLPCMAARFLETVFYPALVLSPVIRSVTLFTGEIARPVSAEEDEEGPNPERWQAVLDRLDDVSPSLHTFKVDSFISSFHDGTLPAVPHFDNLHERLSANLTTMVVTGVSLSPKAIWSISELEGLAALTLTLDHRAYDFPPSTLLSFPALIKLHLLADGEYNEDICDPFIRPLSAPRLLDLQIDYNLQYHTHDVPLQRLFLSLAVPSVAPKISTIKIEKFNRNDHWCGDFNYSVPGAHLLPLASKNITRFEVSPCATREAEISDKELLQLFSAWPNLETFILDKVEDDDDDDEFDGPMGEEPILTLAGVSTAIRRCPLLKNLTLRCDARQIPPPDDESPHLSLISWDVCTSLIKSGAAFAAWAKRACPNLTVVDSFVQLRFSMDVVAFKESMVKRTSKEKADVIMLSHWDDVSRILSKRPQSS
ncbi:hypothetical protein BKA70DRAFT_540232 [Coprinopsis sp. MPI-PUGE-AT-0042]|nr:hypothetical protein BKA70DRAFT_540232 [Coprinopsis sp. MPI-PUGE-AT-0042]